MLQFFCGAAHVVFAAILLLQSSTTAELTMLPEKHTLAIPFELYANLVFVTVRVNGSEPLPFVLDSGASGCCLDIQACKQLGLRPEGSRQGSGAGKGAFEIQFLKNVHLGLEGIEDSYEQIYVLDLSGQLRNVGRDIAGLLGYDFIARHVTEIDYDGGVLLLHDPATYEYAGPGEVVPMTLRKKVPYVPFRLTVPGHQPVERMLMIDSGSSDAIDDSLLEKSTEPLLEVTGGVGLGREFKIVLGRFERVQLGYLQLENVTGAGGGSMLGGEFLHRFTVVFDYEHQRVIFEPNRHFRDDFRFDASGLELRLDPTTRWFEVHTVQPRSPAAECGLRAGDRITAVDGCPASGLDLAQVGALMQNEGHEYRLGIRRGSETLQVSIRLRKLF